MLNMLLNEFEGNLTTSKWARIMKWSQDTALRDIRDHAPRRAGTLSPRRAETQQRNGDGVRKWPSRALEWLLRRDAPSPAFLSTVASPLAVIAGLAHQLHVAQFI